MEHTEPCPGEPHLLGWTVDNDAWDIAPNGEEIFVVHYYVCGVGGTVHHFVTQQVLR